MADLGKMLFGKSCCETLDKTFRDPLKTMDSKKGLIIGVKLDLLTRL